MATQDPTHPAPESSVTGCAATTSINGYTAKQLKDVIEVVASRTRTLQQLLMFTLGCDESYESAVSLDAAVIIATSIGAMTDTILGGEILGDADHWNFGPNFADAGKAVQS